MQTKKTSFLLSILFGFSIIFNIKSSEMTTQENAPKILYAKNLLHTNNQFKNKNLGPTFFPMGMAMFIIIYLPIAYQLIADICKVNYEDIPLKIGLLVMPLFLIFSCINARYKNTNKFESLNEIVDILSEEVTQSINKNCDKECLVCLNNDNNQPLYVNFTCGHFYHKECLSKWINTATKDQNPATLKCVVCKKSLIKLLLNG